MAERLDVSVRTIRRDLDAIQDDIDAMTQGDLDDLLLDIHSQHEAIREELWQSYHLCKQNNNPSAGLGCLRELRKAQQSYVDVLQKTGVLDAAAQRVELSGSDGGPLEFTVLDFDSVREQAEQDGLPDDLDTEGITIDIESVHAENGHHE